MKEESKRITLTLQEASRLYGPAASTFRRLVAEGQLTATRAFGNRLYVFKDEIEALMRKKALPSKDN